MSKINKNLHTLTIFLFINVFFFFLGVQNIFAATISIYPSSANYSVGDVIKMKVVIDSNTSVNAVSSAISFSSDVISLSSISKSSSIVSLWAKEPSFSSISGIVNLEGVILNGFTGSGGNIATLIFNAKKEGQAEIKFSEASILANDGNGTEVIAGKNPSFITIAKAIEKPKEKPTTITTPVENIVEKTKEAVVAVREVEKANNLPNYSLVIVLMLLIILLLILIIIYGIYYIKKLWIVFKKKISKTSNSVLGDLEVLRKDLNDEIIIADKIRKNENLKLEEISFQIKFEKDINNAEGGIVKEIKELEIKE